MGISNCGALLTPSVTSYFEFFKFSNSDGTGENGTRVDNVDNCLNDTHQKIHADHDTMTVQSLIDDPGDVQQQEECNEVEMEDSGKIAKRRSRSKSPPAKKRSRSKDKEKRKRSRYKMH